MIDSLHWFFFPGAYVAERIARWQYLSVRLLRARAVATNLRLGS